MKAYEGAFTLLPLYPEERAPGTHWLGGWVDPRAGLDDVGENSLPYRDSNSEPSVFQPVASRYTDWAIPAPNIGNIPEFVWRPLENHEKHDSG
jgi:hypothetical protein